MPLSAALYVHIPFCRSKCSYCDFFSVICPSAIPEAYIEALITEACERQKQFDIKSWRTIYIGGGTPSLLDPCQLSRLMQGLSSVCLIEKNAECTIECNPDDITEEFLLRAAGCGITRLSLGIQAMDDAPLMCIARRCSRKTNMRALELIESFWPVSNRFSVDLIAGLPLHTYESFCSGLQKILKTRADHVSLYSLMIEENTPLYRAVKNGSVFVDEDMSDTFWLKGREMLKKASLAQYEVSNFARTGCESRHNLVYWNMDPYVGIGAGATGTVGSYRYTNTTDINCWINERKDEPEILSADTQEFEFLMMGFRTCKGISEKEFERRFEKPFTQSAAGTVFASWQQKGLAVHDDGRFFLTEEGILFLNRFLSEITDVSLI